MTSSLLFFFIVSLPKTEFTIRCQPPRQSLPAAAPTTVTRLLRQVPRQTPPAGKHLFALASAPAQLRGAHVHPDERATPVCAPFPDSVQT